MIFLKLVLSILFLANSLLCFFKGLHAEAATWLVGSMLMAATWEILRELRKR